MSRRSAGWPKCQRFSKSSARPLGWAFPRWLGSLTPAVARSLLDNVDFGLKAGGELEVESTICHEIRQSHELVVIDDVDESPQYRDHHTPAIYGLKSYISVPIIRRDDSFFATLCAIDPAPHKVDNPETIGMFQLFAKLIASNLDSNADLVQAQIDLAEERELAVVREQFVAVLGHDLRNPIASMMAGIRLGRTAGMSAGSRNVLVLMQSSAIRMRDLVDNVLDFARARLGEGLRLDVLAEAPLRPVLENVVEEIRPVYSDLDIHTDFELDLDVRCDHPRISQLLSNLIGRDAWRSHKADQNRGYDNRRPIGTLGRQQWRADIRKGQADPVPALLRGEVSSQQGLGLASISQARDR